MLYNDTELEIKEIICIVYYPHLKTPEDNEQNINLKIFDTCFTV